jgi:hypothetical protein
MRVGSQRHALAALPLGKRHSTHCMNLGGPVRKISPAPRFDLRTVQSVASGYTDKYVTRNVTKMFNDAAYSLLCHFVRKQRTKLITSPL